MTPVRVFTAADLAAMLAEASLFQADLARWRQCEEADAAKDAKTTESLRRQVVGAGFIWAPKDASRAEVDALYGMAREAARITLARRSAAFRARFGIELTCGDEPAQAGGEG